MMADLMEGIRYTASHPSIAALLVLLIALGIGGRPLSELLPGIAADVFRSGAGGLSLLASSMGGGAILGGLWLGHRAHSSNLTEVAVGSSIGGGGDSRGNRERHDVDCDPAVAIVGLCHVLCRYRHPEFEFSSRPTAPCADASWASMG